MKRSSLGIIMILLFSGCAQTFFYPGPEQKKLVTGYNNAPIYFISLFTKKKINWYGEMDRNWVTFHRIDPLYNYLSKQLLTFLKLSSGSIDFVYAAKSAGIKETEDKHYTIQEKGIMLTREIDFYTLAQHLKMPDNSLFLVIEVLFDVSTRNIENSETLSQICLVLKNRNGKTIFKKHYIQRNILDREKYMTLVSYQKRDREKIAKLTHQLFVEGFLALSTHIIKDLTTITKGN